MSELELWSSKRIAEFLDMSENYTRNVVIKQSQFPQPRFTTIVRDGKAQKSKPRWFSQEVVSWAKQVYVNESEYTENKPARPGRKRLEK